MPICSAMVKINDSEDDEVEFISISSTADDIEMDLMTKGESFLKEIGQRDCMYYVYMKKESFKLNKRWQVVGNASKFDGNWEVLVQYGVWACMYETEIPPFNKKPIENKQKNVSSILIPNIINLSNLESIDNLDEYFERNKSKKHKKKVSHFLDKDFSITDMRCRTPSQRERIIEFPIIKVDKKKLKKCNVELYPLKNSDTKSKLELLGGCVLIQSDSISLISIASACESDYNYSD